MAPLYTDVPDMDDDARPLPLTDTLRSMIVEAGRRLDFQYRMRPILVAIALGVPIAGAAFIYTQTGDAHDAALRLCEWLATCYTILYSYFFYVEKFWISELRNRITWNIWDYCCGLETGDRAREDWVPAAFLYVIRRILQHPGDFNRRACEILAECGTAVTTHTMNHMYRQRSGLTNDLVTYPRFTQYFIHPLRFPRLYIGEAKQETTSEPKNHTTQPQGGNDALIAAIDRLTEATTRGNTLWDGRRRRLGEKLADAEVSFYRWLIVKALPIAILYLAWRYLR